MTTASARWIHPLLIALVMGCATLEGGTGGGAVVVEAPQAVDGDPHALAWPFQVATEARLRGFRLKLDSGGTLVAVRPDAANPEPSAPGWAGSLQDGTAIWSGRPSSGRRIPLTIMVRAEVPGDQELHVRYAVESAGGITGWTCERWLYRVAEGRIERDAC